MSKPITVELKTPIKANDGEQKTALTFNQPTLGDLIDCEENHANETARVSALLARMCGLSFAEFCQITTADFAAINTACEPLTKN